MLQLGLSATGRANLRRTLRDTHRRKIEVRILNLEGDVLETPTRAASVLDGQVTVDGEGEVTRSLSLTLLDPTYSLNLDTASADDGALYLDRMVQVIYSVFVEGESWIDVPVFTGPITGLSRDGATVAIEAQGKEALARQPIHRPLTIPRGTRRTDAIRTLMRERAGEDLFSIPKLAARLPQPLSFDRERVAWIEALRLARSLSRQLFYDGRGRLVLRKVPRRAVWTFRAGNGGDVLSRPRVSYDSSELVNVVRVVGGEPRCKNGGRATAIARPPATHPLSPERLGRNGVPRYLPLYIEDDQLDRTSEAQELADDTLRESLEQRIDVSFDALPIPHLEPGDLVEVETDSGTVSFRLKRFTIPLTSGAMSVGYTRPVTPRRQRIRRPR